MLTAWLHKGCPSLTVGIFSRPMPYHAPARHLSIQNGKQVFFLSTTTNNIMNQRTYCQRCERPLSRCLCTLACHVQLPWRLVVLQDPGEKKQAKGSVALLRACLPELTVWCSPDFAHHPELGELLADPKWQCVLLYPGDRALPVEEWSGSAHRHLCFIVLDGTWRKSLKLLHSHPQLARLPRVALRQSAPSRYLIRKSPRQDGLSTFEAVSGLLAEWQARHGSASGVQDAERLFACFARWIDRELAALPAEIRARYPTRQPTTITTPEAILQP
jgi:DTW domain-containing protein YfiP